MRLNIQSGQGAYAVDMGDPIEDAVGSLLEVPAVVVIDGRVAELHSGALAPLLAAHPHLSMPALESEKSFEGVQRVLAFLQDTNSTKRTTLIAIGGGIIQDIASFAAHIYYRGLPWVFLPSTLLAMADSCIGAKCALNFRGFKNQIGAFHSPSRVALRTEFLSTLSDQDVLSGYGEILKLMLTEGEEAFEHLVRSVSSIGFRGDTRESLSFGASRSKRGSSSRMNTSWAYERSSILATLSAMRWKGPPTTPCLTESRWPGEWTSPTSYRSAGAVWRRNGSTRFTDFWRRISFQALKSLPIRRTSSPGSGGTKRCAKGRFSSSLWASPGTCASFPRI